MIRKTILGVVALAAVVALIAAGISKPARIGLALSEADGGAAGHIEVLTDAGKVADAWPRARLPGDPPKSLGDTVVIIATAATSATCPARFDGLHVTGQVVRVPFHYAGDACGTGGKTRTFAISVRKAKLPSGTVSVQVTERPPLPAGSGSAVDVTL